MTNQREIKKKNISRESYLSTTIATFPSFLLFNLLVLVMVFLPMLTSMPSPGNNNYNNKRNPSYILSLTKIGLGIYLLFLAIQIFQGRNDDKDGDGNGDMKRRITRYATMHGKSYPMVVKLYDVRRERMESDCENAVDKLIENGIKVLALDFDLTMIDIHTGGEWDDTPEELAKHIRPEMRCVVDVASKKGMIVAIATFSGQHDLIQQTLQHTVAVAGTTSTRYPSSSTSSNIDDNETKERKSKNKSSNILFQGGRNRSEKNGKINQLLKIAATAFSTGNNHKGSAGTPLMLERPQLATILLIDDDPKNVKLAQKDGFSSLRYYPDRSDMFLSSLTNVVMTPPVH